MIIPLYYPIPVNEDIFTKKPSDKGSLFYKNHQTIQMFIQLMKELKSSKFEEIITKCDKQKILKISNEIDSNIGDNFKFTRTVKELTGLDYDSISKVYKKWKFYSELDKVILIRCSVWERTINEFNFE